MATTAVCNQRLIKLGHSLLKAPLQLASRAIVKASPAKKTMASVEDFPLMAVLKEVTSASSCLVLPSKPKPSYS